ncbi:ESPR-type extended signal peptide-containing protein [Acinetobacter baumannii]|uniref:ESPR-type extended signal peptide-containing protein n=1 Tax=Acinetobacter baumannii TaxID=470 RepID=UPI003EDAEA10
MNRIYRVVWNASIGAWVAVSENAKSKTKTKTVKVVAVAIAIASSAVMPVYADVLAGNNITVTPSGTDFVVATTDDVSLNKVTVGSVELDKTTNTVKVGTNTTLSTAGLDTDGSVKTGTLTTTGSATIGNGLTVVNGTTALKNTNITGTLTTTENTTVGGTLGVTGATTLNNTLNVVGNTTLSNVTTTGSATIGNGLTVADGATALKNTNITGTLTTTGNTTVGGTLNVNGLATFNNGANLNNKKITGLAAGNINSATSTDAVNGGQLYTVNKNIADALGTQLDANGALENPTYTVSDGKGGTQSFNNIRQAIEYITGIDTTGNGGVGVGIKYFHTNSAAADSQSKGLESVAIGPQAIANGTSSIAMGDQARAEQENAVAIGKESAAIGLNSTAIGSTTGTPRQPVYTRDANNKITAIDGISVTTTGTGTNLTDITEINGVPVTNTEVNSFVASLSSGANLSLGKNSIALGTSNLAAGESSVALGDSSKAVAKDAIAIGRNGNASGEQAISIGAGAQAAASGALAAGRASNAGRDGAVALGQGAFANTTAGISIGQNAGAGTSQGTTNDRTDHIAIGRNSGQNVIGNRNIALGIGAGSNLSVGGNDSSDDNIAIGVNAGSNLNGDDNIAIGRDANKNITAVAESVAIGSRVDATTGSTVLGNEAKASGGDYATVLGYKAKVTGDSGTALGRDSEASTNNIALGASSIANGNSTEKAFLTGDIKANGYNIVSVGQIGQERRITNVAAGANPTDAVNVNQLYEAQKNVASLIGGQTGVDPATGTFTGYIIELTDTAGQTHQYKDVSSAINAVSSGAISVLPGNAAMYTADGRISNVAAGTQATDAVNLAQLNQAIADNGQHHVSINSKNPANKNNTGATADESLAIGAGVTTSNAGVKSVVIGFDAATNAKESVAIGNTSTQANGDASIAIGKTALAKSTNNIAMGTNASSNGMESIALGTNIQIDKTAGTSDYAVGIGSYSEVQNADQAIAIGRKAIVQGDNGTAIGHESRAAKENASALGNFAKATAVSANAIGNYATASGTSANAIGDNAKATAGNANAMGKSAEATSTSSNAIGDSAKAAADNASAIGTNAQATAVSANAIGTNAQATGVNANAIGTGAQALRQDTLALGASAVASGLNASAIGKSADAAGLNANALGNRAKAGAESSNAIGTDANVSATNGFALGTGATVTHTNAVALGSGSISGNATPTASAIVNGKIYNYAGINPTSTVSVGSLGNERQIINVAAGRVSGSSTDAINGSQLFQTNEELANLANKTAQALGGGALANQASGAISAPSYTVTTNPAGTGTKTTVNNVGAALTALDTAVNQPLSFAGDTGAQISRKLGETLNVKGGATGTLAATGNIGVVANGTNQLDIRLAETINLGSNGSVTTGSASIKNNEVKVGTNTLTDTGLKAGNVRVNTSTNDVTGLSNTTWNPAGTYNSGRAATEEQLLSAQNQLNTTLTDKGFSISAQGANSDKVKLGETVDFRNTDGNLVATRSADNTINYDLAKNINLDKVTLGNIVIDKATGINAGNQKITNVKAGDVNSTSTDAVNGSQLYTAQNNVKNVLGSSTQIDAAGNLTSTNIGGVTGANTVHDAIQQVNNTATNAKTQADKGLNFAVNGVTPADNVQLGETVNFADGTNTTATYDALTNTYKYSLNDTLSLSNAGSLSIKDSAGTGTVVSVDKTGVQSGSIKLDASTGKITGVTDGLVAAGSKDAVNGGQLDAVKAIANTGWKLTTDKTGTGAVAGSSVEQITPDETVTFIAGDNIAVEQAGNKVTVATKKDVVFDRVTSTDILGNTSILSATGIITQDKDGKKSASLSNTGLFVAEMNATGNTLSSSSLEAGKLTVKGTNTLVLDSVKGTLTGLSNKTLGSGDFASQGRAATEEQLNRAQSNVASILGGNAANNGGLLSMSNIGGTGESTIDDAIKSVNQVANNANKGWNVSTNGGTANNVKPNDTVDFSNKDGNVTVSNQGNNITVDLNKDIDLGAAGSVTTGDTKIDNNGLTIAGGPSVTKNGIDAGKQKVTNVADGKITADSQDAVNGGQIHDMMGAGAYDTNGNLSNIGGTGQSNINDAIAAVNKTAVQSKSTVTEGSNIKVVSNSNADGSTNYTVSTADDITLNSVTAKDINAGTVTTDKVVAGNTTVDSSGLSIKNGPSVTASGIDAGSKVVSNVSNGVQNSDAVNMGQLSQYLGGGAGYNNITQSFDAPNYQVNGGSYNNVGDALGALNQADQALGNRITNLGDQLQQAFYSTNQRIDDVEKKANAGIAAAMALENAPYIPGKYTYAAGAAYHGGENAIGLTLRKTADNGRWSLTGGVAAGSSGDPSVRVGISGVID